MTVTVDVQWALQGKTLGREDTRVLACSTGELSMSNFTEVISRFNIGTMDDLPQVSVSYLPSATLPGRLYYLGVGIHDWAADVRTTGGRLLERDDDNRPIVATAYFCIPYQPLADAAVSYRDMYHVLSGIQLATTSGPPLKVEFPARTAPSAIGPLAVQSAARLLTGRPVCVLDARTTTVIERLEFIDAVAALLPYGFRTRLAAATWVRPYHRNHRFRLCFSSAKRDSDLAEDAVYWGRPETTALTPDDDYAYAYQRWLNDVIDQPYTTLAQLTEPRSFTDREVLEFLDELDEIALARLHPDESAAEEPPTRAVEPPGPGDDLSAVEQALRECASSRQPLSAPNLSAAITRLQAQARQRISPEERERCRAFIRENYLFRHDKAMGSLEGKLRDALFKIAFASPLSYQDYCLIEDSLGNHPPDLKLLRMITDAKMSDGQTEAVVYGQLLRHKEPTKLDNWHRSRQMTPAQLVVELINAVAGRWDRDRHVIHAAMAAAEFANQVPGDPLPLREALQRHHYLVRLLQTVAHDSDQAQVYVLYRLLRAAYPTGLSKSDIQQILIDNPDPPSPGLLASVLLQPRPWKDPKLAHLAREAYVSRTTLGMALDQDVLKALRAQLFTADGWPTDPAPAARPPTTDHG